MHEFPSFAPAERAWLRRQVTRYDDLHSGQPRLLTDIGLTDESTHTRPVTPYAETALAHAHAYTAAHGSLATPYCAVHDGFPLGPWLARQRLLAQSTNTPYAVHRALTTLDPWWNPHWPMRWQRAYHHARTTPITAPTSSWASTQRAAWHRLHPQQRALLTGIGLTPENRTTAQHR
ncbi:Helicase associated domain protein [Streptomyces sp. NPDC127190]|uniref:Helicase associated domain protein n=1 Tax=unclassified Streptomyces TaxID=2593676 RepID=UPI003640BE9B